MRTPGVGARARSNRSARRSVVSGPGPRGGGCTRPVRPVRVRCGTAVHLLGPRSCGLEDVSTRVSAFGKTSPRSRSVLRWRETRARIVRRFCERQARPRTNSCVREARSATLGRPSVDVAGPCRRWRVVRYARREPGQGRQTSGHAGSEQPSDRAVDGGRSCPPKPTAIAEQASQPCTGTGQQQRVDDGGRPDVIRRRRRQRRRAR